MSESSRFRLGRFTFLALLLTASGLLWLNMTRMDLAVVPESPDERTVAHGRGWPWIWKVESHTYGLPGAVVRRKKSKDYGAFTKDIAVSIGILLVAGIAAEWFSRRRRTSA